MRRTSIIPITRDWMNYDRSKPEKKRVAQFVPALSIEVAKDCPRMMGVGYVADLLSVNPCFVREEIKDGNLQATDISRGKRPLYRIHREHLASYLLERRVS
jgi:hypothetical protein